MILHHFLLYLKTKQFDLKTIITKFFRFNHQLIWSEKDQAAFTAFTTHFTADECLPFIINKKKEHLYFFQPDKITKQTIDLISFDPRFNYGK